MNPLPTCSNMSFDEREAWLYANGETELVRMMRYAFEQGYDKCYDEHELFNSED